MNTRSKRQAYAAALSTISELFPYYSAFAVGLMRPEIEQKFHLHRDSLPPEPRYWQQMLTHRFAKEFHLATVQEIGELTKRGIYQLIEKNQDQARIPLTWVFKYKFDTDGYLVKFKARLCVRGDLQTTEEETYAATLAARTFRAIMAIAAAFDMEIHQFDAVNAFINSRLDEEIFCESPEGFRESGKCWKLLRILYGLKQAPMLWYIELTTALENLHLMPVPGVNCLFANDWLIVFFYVDDIVVLSTKQNTDKLQEFEKALLMKFHMRALGELNWFLGIQIIRNRESRKIWLCQDFYISKIAAKFNLKNSKNFSTPLAKIPREGDTEIESTDQMIFAYQQRVESLNFAAVITRPNIAWATSRVHQELY